MKKVYEPSIAGLAATGMWRGVSRRHYLAIMRARKRGGLKQRKSRKPVSLAKITFRD